MWQYVCCPMDTLHGIFIMAKCPWIQQTVSRSRWHRAAAWNQKTAASCSLKVYWTATITGAIGAVGGNIYNVQQQPKDSCLTRLRHIGLIVTTAPKTGDDNNWDNHNSYCGWWQRWSWWKKHIFPLLAWPHLAKFVERKFKQQKGVGKLEVAEKFHNESES